jgi:phospholipid/cholesterol/gamma-HCH transport system substrate-binding protein
MPRNVRLGLFVLGALVILSVCIFLIGRQQGMFRRGYTLKAEFTNVSGLQNGAEVRVGGINEGTVKLIQLPNKPGEKVTVIMELAKNTRNVIKKDSVGAIRTEGMVGAKFVEISFGSANSPDVQDGDTIQSEQPLDFSDLLKKTNGILDSTGELTSHMASAAANLDEISAKINGGKGSLGQLVNDKQIYQQLSQTTQQAAEGASAFKDNMQALQHNFLLRGFFKKRGYNDAEELTAHQAEALPEETAAKTFNYDAKRLFDKADSPKLKDAKMLADAGQYLQANRFGSAVILTYTGGKGDTENDKILTEARSMLVRDYLVKNFSIPNDTMIKTMGVGKNAPEGGDPDGGVQILIYPPGVSTRSTNSQVLTSHQ